MQPKQLTKREMRGDFRLGNAGDWTRRLREIGIYAVIGAFLTIISPYNASGSLPLWAAYLYWTGLVLTGGLSAETTRTVMERSGQKVPVPAMMAIMSVTSALAVTAMIILLEAVISGRAIPPGYLPRLFGLVWVLAAAVTAVGFMIERTVLAPVTEPVKGASPEETFLSRLPVKYRTAKLYAVSAEDHYLRIHTSHGEELILMRLADAMRELAGADGLQVHRSWWVAKDGVRDTRKQGGKLSLVLLSGKEAPVSRTFQAEVKAAGLAA